LGYSVGVVRPLTLQNDINFYLALADPELVRDLGLQKHPPVQVVTLHDQYSVEKSGELAALARRLLTRVRELRNDASMAPDKRVDTLEYVLERAAVCNVAHDDQTIVFINPVSPLTSGVIASIDKA
jgi:hypothetical protein